VEKIDRDRGGVWRILLNAKEIYWLVCSLSRVFKTYKLHKFEFVHNFGTSRLGDGLHVGLETGDNCRDYVYVRLTGSRIRSEPYEADPIFYVKSGGYLAIDTKRALIYGEDVIGKPNLKLPEEVRGIEEE
jgi:hypothetical protein